MSKVKAMTLDPQTATDIQDFTRQIATEAEEVIFVQFPGKILSLQKLIDEMSDPSSEYNPTHPSALTNPTVYPAPSSSSPATNGSIEPASKKRKVDDVVASDSATSADPGGAVYPQVVHSNAHVRKLQMRNKAEFEEMIKLCDKVKLWINLTMPRIEDGDNFGVQIQEDVVNELSRAQESGYNLRDVARTQQLIRAKLCAKLIKYPNVEDYLIGLKDHDEKQMFMAKQHIYDLRNVYAILFDVLQKNIQKIRAPKGNNSFGMY